MANRSIQLAVAAAGPQIIRRQANSKLRPAPVKIRRWIEVLVLVVVCALWASTWTNSGEQPPLVTIEKWALDDGWAEFRFEVRPDRRYEARYRVALMWGATDYVYEDGRVTEEQLNALREFRPAGGEEPWGVITTDDIQRSVARSDWPGLRRTCVGAVFDRLEKEGPPGEGAMVH